MWFQDRGISYVDPDQKGDFGTNQHELQARTLPGCPLQLTEVMNNQLYATHNINKGDIIEVARGLIISASEAIEGSDLFRFGWHSPDPSGKAVILLLGNGAHYPPVNSRDGVLPAVTYRWYSEDEAAGFTPAELGKDSRTTYTASNSSCSETVLIAFVAARAIDVNEALTVPLIYDVKTAKRTFRNEFLPTSCF